jgi:hypothetical protein
MKKYSTVEEYLEVLAGYRDSVTTKVNTNWFFNFDPIISLARYDVNVLTSMSETVIGNKPLTEKQAGLLCKILLKYQRQFAAHGIDVSPVETPVWRVRPRQMDYTRRLSIENDKIVLRFPFNTKLIDDIRSFRQSCQGSARFDRDAKAWRIGLSEYNVNWLHTWASANEFEISKEIDDLNSVILTAEQTPYSIELQYGPEQLEITNCPSSLRDYVNEHLGGFAHDNLLRLVDSSSLLGITIEDDLRTVINQNWGSRFLQLASNTEVRVNPDAQTVDDDLASVLDYAVQVNRLPVVIYEPDLSERLLLQLRKLYPAEDILTVGNMKKPVIDPSKKFIHTHKPLRSLERIPMLISSAGMIFGGDKQYMSQASEKIVYVAAEVYNTGGSAGNKTRKVVKLASKTNN